MKNYIIVGLTGQSGAGKTTVSNVFKDNNFAIINCDEVARNVTYNGSNCNKTLAKYFPTCFDDGFNLDRKSLAKIVFSNKSKLDLLNQTIFPYINKAIQEQIDSFKNKEEKFILLDAPTLFEAGADKLCDVIVSCIADYEIRADRIKARDNISNEMIRNRFDSQNSDDFFYANSDYIIKNNGNINNAVLQTEKIINFIKGNYNG